MFQFSGFASVPYTFRYRYPCGWVSPFRIFRITARLPAPLNYRRFRRLSSPLDIKASTTCSYQLRRPDLSSNKTHKNPKVLEGSSTGRELMAIAFAAISTQPSGWLSSYALESFSRCFLQHLSFSTCQRPPKLFRVSFPSRLGF